MKERVAHIYLDPLSYPIYTWKCELHPSTYWCCEEGKQPNAFHRFMQRLCFGIKWTRIEELK